MKIKHIYTAIHITVIGALLTLSLPGCKDEHKTTYLNLSVNSYSFDAEGEETLTIKVNSNLNWEANIVGDWILGLGKDNNSITVGVTRNNTAEMRSGRIIFTTGEISESVYIEQLEDYRFAKYHKIRDMNNVVISIGGTYAAGLVPKGTGNSDIVDYTAYRIDLKTGERDSLGNWQASSMTIGAVSDNGVVAVNFGSSYSLYYKDGEWLRVSGPAGNDSNPIIRGMSSDGTVLVGYTGAGTPYKPAKWINGVGELLPVPDYNSAGNEPYNGYMARGCSADGSLIYGSEWTTNWYDLIYWRDGQYHIPENDVRYDLVNIGGTEMEISFTGKVRLLNEVTRTSPDGRYIACTYHDQEGLVGGVYVVQQYAALIDTYSHELTVMWDFPGSKGLTVGNDGSFSFAYPYSLPEYGYIRYIDDLEGEPITANQWIEENLGIYVGENCFIERICEGEQTILGASLVSTSPLYFYVNNNL